MKPLTIALLALSLALTSCGSLPFGGSGQGGGTAGAPSTATSAAQTVGQDQSSVGGTATGGTGVVNNHFAAAGDAAVRMRILELVEAGHLTPEAGERFFANSSSAPHTVTLGNIQASGGAADNAGAGTGGSGAGEGTIGNRP